jgi:hypothetical protein
VSKLEQAVKRAHRASDDRPRAPPRAARAERERAATESHDGVDDELDEDVDEAA